MFAIARQQKWNKPLKQGSFRDAASLLGRLLFCTVWNGFPQILETEEGRFEDDARQEEPSRQFLVQQPVRAATDRFQGEGKPEDRDNGGGRPACSGRSVIGER